MRIQNKIGELENRIKELEKDMLEKKIPDITEELEDKGEIILDISVYPELGNILKRSNRLENNITYYFPDTIEKLLYKAKEDIQYYYFMTKLVTHWTQRSIDFNVLNKIFIEKIISENVNIKLITKEVVDKEVYSFCYKNFIFKDLVIDLSPKFNLIGDIIGKTLGLAKKSKIPILMLNQRLLNDVKRTIPVFDTANVYANKKKSFFQKYIPHLKRTRGIRWFVVITVGTAITPIGFVLTVVDP